MITFACTCGRSLQVPDTMAGKRGRCPACRQVVAVPAARPGQAGLELVDEAPAGPAAPAGSACPGCSVVYPEDVLICVGCGIELATGRALGGPAPDRGRRGAARADHPFHSYVLGMFTAPFATLDALPERFQERSFLLKTIGLLGVSIVLLLLGLTMTLNKAGERAPRPAAQAAGAGWIDARGRDLSVRLRVVSPEGVVAPGETAVLRIEAIDARTDRPFDGIVQFDFQSSEAGAGEISLQPTGTAGEFSAEVTVPENRGQMSGFFYFWPAGTPHPGILDAAGVRHAWNPAGAPKSHTPPAGALVIICLIAGAALLLGPAVNAGLLTVSARVLGDSGSFLAMLGIYAFLTAIWQSLLFPVLLLPPPVVLVFGLFGGVAMFVLQIRGVMAVFGQSALKAFGTTLLAGVFSMVLSAVVAVGIAALVTGLLVASIA